MVEAKDLKAIGAFELNYTTQYRDLVASQMREAYEYGKKGSADELKVPSPSTKRDSSTFIAQSAQTITDKQMAELLFIVKSEVLSRLRKNQLADTVDDEDESYVSDTIDTISQSLTDFYAAKVALTGSLVVAQALNRGRMDTYTANQSLIYAYQWSAVLDTRTCIICSDLDGSVVDQGTYNSSDWEPPIHFLCRCIIVAILVSEVDPPDITGYPESPGGVEEPAF